MRRALKEEHVHHYGTYWCMNEWFYDMNFKLFRSRFTHPIQRYPASLTPFTISAIENNIKDNFFKDKCFYILR